MKVSEIKKRNNYRNDGNGLQCFRCKWGSLFNKRTHRHYCRWAAQLDKGDNFYMEKWFVVAGFGTCDKAEKLSSSN